MTQDLILGLVATLTPEAQLHHVALAALCAQPEVTVGALAEHKVPLTVETRTGEDEALLERLRELPGILGIDVAYAHFLRSPEDIHGQA